MSVNNFTTIQSVALRPSRCEVVLQCPPVPPQSTTMASMGCLLCNKQLPVKRMNTNLFNQHMLTAHMVGRNLDFLLVICLLRDEEREAVKEAGSHHCNQHRNHHRNHRRNIHPHRPHCRTPDCQSSPVQLLIGKSGRLYIRVVVCLVLVTVVTVLM